MHETHPRGAALSLRLCLCVCEVVRGHVAAHQSGIFRTQHWEHTLNTPGLQDEILKGFLRV